jgi:hypothetical protein
MSKLIKWLVDKGITFLMFSPIICVGVGFFSAKLAFFIMLPLCIIYLLGFVFSLFTGDLFSGSSDKYGGDDH